MLVKNPREKDLEKAFGYTNRNELLKACEGDERLASLAAIGVSLDLLGTKALFSVISFMEITTGLHDLRYGRTLLEYLDKSLKTEEIKELTIMMTTIHQMTEGLE